MKYLIGLLWLGVLGYAAIVFAQSYNAGVPASHADFTCPTATGGSPNLASYAVLGTSTPAPNGYAPNRLCSIYANVSGNAQTLRVGDIGVISATQGIPLPGVPAAAGSPAPAPVPLCLQGPVYCAGGGKLSITDINAQ